MNQADVTKLVSKLRIPIQGKPRKLRNQNGPEGRLNKLRKTVTGLIKYERIELNHNRGDEARQYAERLISEAIRHGDCHTPTMQTADYWLLEKELVHKLFKVLVPRFEKCNTSYTKIYKAPQAQVTRNQDKVVLELRGNPYPQIDKKNQGYNRQSIQNILLDAAKNDYRQSKVVEIAGNIGKTEQSTDKKNSTKDDETSA